MGVITDTCCRTVKNVVITKDIICVILGVVIVVNVMKTKQNMDKPKLDKAQEKRFDELLDIIFSKYNVDSPSMDRVALKQHLADELVRVEGRCKKCGRKHYCSKNK